MNAVLAKSSRWLPTQATVREMLAPCLVFIVACLDRQFQTDFWMHLARGGEIVRTGDFVTTDHFTIAGAGAVIHDPNWLSQVVYYRLFFWGGLPLIQTVNALVLSTSIWLLIRLCRRNGASSWAAGMAGIVAFLVAWQTFLIRPQTFSMLLFVLLYAVLMRARRAMLILWPPIILLLWVNIHGGFLIGLVLIGIFALWSTLEWISGLVRTGVSPSPGTLGEGRGEGDWNVERLGQPKGTGKADLEYTLGTGGIEDGKLGIANCKMEDAPVTSSRNLRFAILNLQSPTPTVFLKGSKAPSPYPSPRVRGEGTREAPGYGFLCFLLSFLATPINPSGWRVYQYAFSLTARVLPRHIEEWLPPSMHQWIGQALVASGVLIIVLHVIQRRWPSLRDCLLILVFFPLAMHSARMVVWWAIVATPIVASLLASLESQKGEARSTRFGIAIAPIFCAILVGMCILSLPCLEKLNPLFGTLRSSHRPESDIDFCTARTTGFPFEFAFGSEPKGRRQPVSLNPYVPSQNPLPPDAIIFTRLEWGQYLDWTIGPQQRIFMDGHIELASDSVWKDYCQITSGMPRWEELLNKYHIDCLLLDRSYHSALLSQLKNAPQWTETCRAGDAILLVRTPEETLAHEATMSCPIVEPKETIVHASDGAASAGADAPIRMP